MEGHATAHIDTKMSWSSCTTFGAIRKY